MKLPLNQIFWLIIICLIYCNQFLLFRKFANPESVSDHPFQSFRCYHLNSGFSFFKYRTTIWTCCLLLSCSSNCWVGWFKIVFSDLNSFSSLLDDLDLFQFIWFTSECLSVHRMMILLFCFSIDCLVVVFSINVELLQNT